MNYDGLKRRYWEAKVQRVTELRDRIRERENALAAGRVIPDGADLALGKGRRVRMAVMFIDICSFTSRPAETHDEQHSMLAALNLFFTEMIRIAEDYGGTVEKNTGDGLMAYFEDNGGDPPECGCKRAVSCALTMMAAREYLISPILDASGFVPFAFRVSIDYGAVTIANLGVARGFNSYAAIGSTANFASKMLRNAGEQEIVIGQAAREKLPVDWQIQYTQVHPEPTGWIYRATGLPYLLYKYMGRWSRLTE
ncbi:adenylate/guanylate cyclase domain-containing protein [Burkholderia ambifaria]|uniref:adenylate/guanylate cyclase domain-containing protein n=1 Tax=Burkholderia ambifaria TaxID=152480 RepID=UPI00158F045F|nr:adenylate/guanylate cyclase domain-containing protein [Burkholderia ambifaria]